MSGRMPYFDVLRGLAIVAVVAIHSTIQGLSFPNDSLDFNFTILLRQALNFAVPLFVAISGYFMSRKSINCRSEYFSFLKKSLLKVYIPCMLYSSAICVVRVALKHESFIHEFAKVVTFRSVVPYYFILMIMQLYFFLPLLKRFNSVLFVFISAFVSILSTILIFYIRYYTNLPLPTVVYGGLFSTWIFFFAYGLYLGAGGKVRIQNKLLVLCIIISWLLSCVETYLLYFRFYQAGQAVTAVKPTAFIYSFFIITFLFKNIDFINAAWLRRLGNISFGIFLIHPYLLGIVNSIISKYTCISSQPFLQPLYQLILATTTLFFSYLVIVVTRRILGNKLVGVIGF